MKFNPELKPSLEVLAFVLENERLWPTGFGPWSYPKGETCALGICQRLWPKSEFSKGPYMEPAMAAFGMSEASAMKIFERQSDRNATPQMVAGWIREFIEAPE